MSFLDGKSPTFLVGLLASWRKDVERRGVSGLLPVKIAFSVVVGGIPAYYAPATFWTSGVAISFFGAFATINGLLLALTWSSFIKIYDVLMDGDFATYLNNYGLLDEYHFLLDYIQKAQLLALMASLLALVFAVFPTDVNIIAQKIAMGVSISSLVYAIFYASGSVKIMRDLLWYHRRFRVGGGPEVVAFRRSP